MKKILFGLGGLALAVAILPMFAAFEAHVVNVTAEIENALKVSSSSLDFGTVFPQEHLEKPLAVQLSSSFLAEDRVDDVSYFIRQKPKCGVTNQDSQDPAQNGTQLVGPTWTGHVVVGDNPFTQTVETYYVDCDADRPDEVLQHPNPEFWLLPSLCPYISKNGSDEDGQADENDQTTTSFHQPFTVSNNQVSWLDTAGRLTKLAGDTVDNWIIDLAVPCFGNFCAQDWLSFVQRESGNPDVTQQQADMYTQPIENEHKVFGCDLWIEVNGVSETPVQ